VAALLPLVSSATEKSDRTRRLRLLYFAMVIGFATIGFGHTQEVFPNGFDYARQPFVQAMGGHAFSRKIFAQRINLFFEVPLKDL
jgi:hypothetical protein